MRTLLERTKDELNSNNHWSRKVVAINLYHNSKLMVHPNWHLAGTGKDLGLSRSFVSEAIKLAEALPDNPKLLNLSRRKAIFQVRHK
jgi:hypothetical protein